MSPPRGNYYSLDEESPLARVTITIDPTYEEWSRLMEQMFSDARYRSGSGILVDRRHAPIPRAKDVREIMQFVDRKETTGATRGWALVVADLGSFGMGRMAQALSENENSLSVFREIEEAVHWLAQRSGEVVRPRRQLFVAPPLARTFHIGLPAAQATEFHRAETPLQTQTMKPIVSRIVSGGQTGADRAALDWAITNDVPHGGYCPHGRIAEDGAIPHQYRLTELTSRDYEARTERNAQESDGTIIFTMTAELSGGSCLTATCAARHGKRALHVWAGAPRTTTVEAIRSFVIDNRIAVLNVAGSRASEEPEIGAFVLETLTEALLA